MAIAVMAAAAMYRPLVFWAENAWDLSSPIKPILFGVVLLVVEISIFAVCRSLGARSIVPPTMIALLTLGLMNWTLLRLHVLLLLAGVFLALALRKLRRPAQEGLVVLLIVIFGLAPLLQVALAHITRTDSYETVELLSNPSATPTGRVEDLVLIIVDGYPSRVIAEEWFGHETVVLADQLNVAGYEVQLVGWSQFIFTALAVPSLLELQPIADAGPTDYDNTRSLYSIARGDSFVSKTLRRAGFRYTHIESGWDGDTCDTADQCVRGPFIDEKMWRFLGTSLFGRWLATLTVSPNIDATLNTHHALTDSLKLIGDGTPDFIYAHYILPHEPFVVDSGCEPSDGQVTKSNAITSQLQCVDSLIAEVAAVESKRAAVLFIGDHGTNTLNQRSLDPDQWSDEQILEAFGTFLAYRLPDTCDPPISNTNLAVMRAAMSCSVELDLPADHGRYLIGADNPQWVDEERMTRIMEEADRGAFHP